jgi:hypothetical protein
MQTKTCRSIPGPVIPVRSCQAIERPRVRHCRHPSCTDIVKNGGQVPESDVGAWPSALSTNDGPRAQLDIPPMAHNGLQSRYAVQVRSRSARHVGCAAQIDCRIRRTFCSAMVGLFGDGWECGACCPQSWLCITRPPRSASLHPRDQPSEPLCVISAPRRIGAYFTSMRCRPRARIPQAMRAPELPDGSVL